MSNKTPKTFLVGSTQPDWNGLMAYLEYTGQTSFYDECLQYAESTLHMGGRDPLCLVSFYAKLCYKSLTEGKNLNVSKIRSIQANLEGVYKSGHGSVFEHVWLNFVTTDCSRVFTHELVRHRVGTAFCLSGDAQVYSGAKVNGKWNGVKNKWTMRQLWNMTKTIHGRSRLKLIMVRCFDGAEFVQAKIKQVIKSGKKAIFKVVLSDGKTIRCSWDHRFMARKDDIENWFSLKNLRAGDSIATNGRSFVKPSKAELKFLYLIEDKTQQQIADEYDVSEALVKKWLASYEINKPGGGRFENGTIPPNKGVTGKVTFFMPKEAKGKISKSRMGSKNPMWKDGLSVKQKNARKLRKSECEECGSEDQLQIHHKDRNHFNDNLSNLRTLCNSCHQTLHQEEDGNGNSLVPKWKEIVSIEPDGYEMTYDLEIDHPSHNFVANGFVTHNSQTSGRYVAIDSIDLVIPPELQGQKINFRFDNGEVKEMEVEEILGQEISSLVNVCKQLRDGLIKDDMSFDKKKKITSAIRRLAPNGQTNEIGWSVNVRALRHLIELRTSRHAEWEIRVVFNEVAKIIEDRWPMMLFGEGERLEVDGLLEYKNLHI